MSQTVFFGASARISDLLIVFFDGECNLCDGTVRWLLAHDRYRKLYFCALQSPFAQDFARRHGLPTEAKSIIFSERGTISTASTAALRIAGYLPQPWRSLRALLGIPTFLRNMIYSVIAHYRFAWFGRRDLRPIDPAVADRFLFDVAAAPR